MVLSVLRHYLQKGYQIRWEEMLFHLIYDI